MNVPNMLSGSQEDKTLFHQFDRPCDSGLNHLPKKTWTFFFHLRAALSGAAAMQRHLSNIPLSAADNQPQHSAYGGD